MGQRPSQQRGTTSVRSRLAVGALTAAAGIAVALTVASPAGSASALSTTSCVTASGTTACASLAGPRPMSVRWQ